jgi:two-component system sensor histidine kinase VicK
MPLKVPGAFPITAAARKAGLYLTVRWRIPRSICETAEKGNAIALRSGRSGVVSRFFVNGVPLFGKQNQVLDDREAVFAVPPKIICRDSANYVSAVYTPARNGDFFGIRTPPIIGEAGLVFRSYYTDMVVSFFMLGCFLVIALYYIILGMLRIKDIYNLYFGLLTLFFFLFMTANTIVKEIIYPFNSLFDDKVDLTSGIAMMLFMLLFILRLIGAKPAALTTVPAGFLSVLAIISLFVEGAAIHVTRQVWYAASAALIPYAGFLTGKKAFTGSLEARVVFGALLVFIISGIHDFCAFYGYVPFTFTMPYAFIAFIFVMTILLALKFVSVHNQTEILNEQLESRVRERTQELENSNRQKDKMISVIAHDLNNPITAINITAGLMDISVKNREFLSISEYSDVIKQACTRAINTITDVLQQARRKEKDGVLTLEPADLGPYLAPLLAVHQVRAQEKGVYLAFQKSRQPLMVHLNTARFSRVIDNLVSNAIKFTPAGGRVTVSVGPEGEFALITVADTGIGIPDEIRATIFERFTGAGRQGTNSEATTGLGLSIAKDIVQEHAGKIWFTSEKQKGSTFFVELPKAG